MLHLDDEDASEPEEVAIDSHGRVRGVSACVMTRDAHFLDVRTKVATNALPPAVAADLVGDCEAAFVLVFPLSHRPGCCPVANRLLLRFATSLFARKSPGGVSRGPKHSSARSQETTQPSAHHEDHLRILLRLPRHARGVRPRGHRAVRHLRHAQVRARRVTFLSEFHAAVDGSSPRRPRR